MVPQLLVYGVVAIGFVCGLIGAIGLSVALRDETGVEKGPLALIFAISWGVVGVLAGIVTGYSTNIAVWAGVLYASVMFTTVEIGEGSGLDSYGDGTSGCWLNLLMIVAGLVWLGVVGLLGGVLPAFVFYNVPMPDPVKFVVALLALVGPVVAIVVVVMSTHQVHIFFGRFTSHPFHYPGAEALKQGVSVAIIFAVTGLITQFVPGLLNLLHMPIPLLKIPVR